MNKEKKRLRNWLFQRINIVLFVLTPLLESAQIANYVNNGGFEQNYNCVIPSITSVKYWRSIDSSISSNVGFYSTCFPNVPSGGLTYQWPRTGNNFCYPTFLCQPPQCTSFRGYARNRLKSNLQSGITYCVKFYVCVGNPATYGIDGFGAYFGDNSLDTITKCCVPLTYLVPQVQNIMGNIISDTLNWTLITGTFVANGTEKHMVIGNFKSDAATTKTLINSTNLPYIGMDACIDDVSCIPVDLPAYAGPDIWCIPGNSVYIGRPSDVGIDEACMWYKLPNTTTAIDTVAGLWVSPVVTTTYVVKQDICGIIKYDTVVVHQSATGISTQDAMLNNLYVYPVPTKDELTVSFNVEVDFTTILIYNELGQNVREREIKFNQNKASIKTTDLPNGVYYFTLKDNKDFRISKRFVVTH